MKQVYAIIIVSFMCLGMQAQAGPWSVQEGPAPVIDPVAAEAPAEVFADVVDETRLAPQPVVDDYVAGPVAKSGVPAWQEKATTVSITSITMPVELNITHFDNYQVDVELNVPTDYTVHTVTLSTTPVTFADDQFVDNYDWNYYTHDSNGSTANNDPVVKTKTDPATPENHEFTGIRPDDIYPEIYFASSDITHNNEPDDILINQDNQQLMHFNNPFNMVENTAFFIEFYAEPANPNPPPPVGLDVYLVPSGVVSSGFQQEDWVTSTGAVLVGTIGRDKDFHHTHTTHSKHHLVELSADASGNVQGLDVTGDFWVVLTAKTSDARRSWNLKYHPDDGSETTCDNNGTWFIGDGSTTSSQTGCPDSHVHIARNTEGVQVDGVEHVVTVDYSDDGDQAGVEESSKYFYFGDIPNLPPNASSFTGPPAGIHSGTVTLDWNPATDPNNHNVVYDIYLYDVGTQTDVYTVTKTVSGESFGFDCSTASDSETDPPADGVYNIRMVARDATQTDLYSSPFFLYDIYVVGEEFVIANDPHTWTGDTDSDWNNAGNWDKDAPPGQDDLAFVPENVTNNLTIPDGVGASAKRLSIADGEIVTIQNGGSLTVGQSLVNDAGINGLVVEDGGSLIHHTPWTSEGIQATLKRPITGGGTWTKAEDDGWHLLSSPVGTQTITTFTTDESSGNGYDFYGWSEEDDLWINQKGPGTEGPDFSEWNGDDFVVGRGYLVAYEATQDFEFTGGLNIQDVTKEQLTKTSNTENPPYGEGWQLLGNPFASGLDWGDGSWVSTNIAETAKIWSNGGYKDVQSDLSSAIPAHQGFFVQVTTATGSITIPAAARKHVGTAWQKQNEVPHILMTASANDSGLRQRNVVRKDPANGSDYNAVFLAGNAPQFYAIPDEVPLSTIAPEEITDDTVIPYAFIKNNEGSEFRIALEKTMEDKALYLVDLLADVEHHLTIDEPYIFTSSDDDPAERFELHFASADDPTSVDPPEEATDDARIYVTDGVLYIEFPGAVENAELQLIDALGRKVLNNDLGNGSHFSVPLGLNTGAYIVRLSSSDHLITKKIVIR